VIFRHGRAAELKGSLDFPYSKRLAAFKEKTVNIKSGAL
jgi:hypothetical protein